jgi:hypothetical protein
VEGPHEDPSGGCAAHGRVVIFFGLIHVYACFCGGHRPSGSGSGGAMANQLEGSHELGFQFDTGTRHKWKIHNDAIR